MPSLRTGVAVAQRALWIVGGVAVWYCAWSVPFALPLVLRPSWALPMLLVMAVIFIYHPRLGRARWRRRRAAELQLRMPRSSGWRLLAFVPLVLMVDATTGELTSRFLPPPRPLDLPYPLAALPLGSLVVPAFVVITAPLLEEFAFRGFLQRRLSRLVGVPVAVALTAAGFGALHRPLPWFPYYFTAGLLYSYAVLATRSLWVPVILHAAGNAMATMPAWAKVTDLDPLARIPIAGVALLAVALLALAVRVVPLPGAALGARRHPLRARAGAGAQLRSMAPIGAPSSSRGEVHLVE